ncbi:ABC transporter ATP-binding protein [Haloglomus irregulare]|jgi:ABC-2 type transport system ATP-binding protein|uniref:ABC transporter ATP-binding protein n=1 Tax=Haloglomus irregulare TaxID=2234134 RepID=A0A554MXX2_9EURY|nr:ABC transporter ATP-binding protein [Haloglomus irregulare]TSD09988.1 ABC transporter ATP-binding protein [Haloglomus irregulare]
MAAIELDGVSKRYGAVTALDDLSLTVDEGEVFGFLGPNGAGKSTAINVLLDFVQPDAGEVRLLGDPIRREESAPIRDRVGVLPEGFGVYGRLSGRKHLEFAVDSKAADQDPDELLERVGLTGDGGRPAGDYSRGMQQRLVLAMALVGEPDLLVLDEPSTGLDPNGARRMREVVREEAARGATVFFSSHILGQVEAVCDRVGIIRDGEMIAVDSVAGLREASGAESVLEIAVGGDPSAAALDAVRELGGVSEVRAAGDQVTVTLGGDVRKTAVLDALESAGVEVADFETRETSLEDLFTAYTGGGSGDRRADTDTDDDGGESR